MFFNSFLLRFRYWVYERVKAYSFENYKSKLIRKIFIDGIGPGRSGCLVYGNEDVECQQPLIPFDKFPTECSSFVYDGFVIDPDSEGGIDNAYEDEDSKGKNVFGAYSSNFHVLNTPLKICNTFIWKIVHYFCDIWSTYRI